uniref:SEA domain-containing protein n=1 Tax=Callithrix jacchus TaxID=9483 RepID=F7ANX2_CALJA
MTPGIQSPFFLLLLLIVLTAATGSDHASSPPGGEQMGTTHRNSAPSSTRNVFNSSLEDPNSNYYQELRRNISGLAVWQCRRKNYGQLDIFPARAAYHPMSEYPTYHTHGRYVPPGNTSRSPYEEVSAGNGGSSLSYTNPAVAATSANL